MKKDTFVQAVHSAPSAPMLIAPKRRVFSAYQVPVLVDPLGVEVVRGVGVAKRIGGARSVAGNNIGIDGVGRIVGGAGGAYFLRSHLHYICTWYVTFIVQVCSTCRTLGRNSVTILIAPVVLHLQRLLKSL